MEQTIINANGYSIFIGNNVFDTIRSYLNQYEFKENKIFVLVDENTRKYCLPRLMSNIQLLQQVHILEIPSGEESKSTSVCLQMWQELSKNGADRNSVLINLGGGVVSDLGGFIASTFKRGMRYVNIPTTLLSMVDASIGGKVGIDLNGLKNQIGVFSNPQVVFIIPEFLDTLPERQMINGFAEIVKHSLVYEKHYWDELSGLVYKEIDNWKELIDTSIEIKNYFVTEDPHETGFRKVLNFGHTVGHAIETFSLQHDEVPLLHGESIAIGLICESYISSKVTGLPQAELDEIVHYIMGNFDQYLFRSGNFDIILDIMKHDKKNSGNRFNFTLLTSIGNSLINQQVDLSLIRESLQYYLNLQV
ncbi:MAG TPA: 3-dehydroquinate synthase [Bacteroidales bacterium]|nr:3-dehydroquinate synthase [Bacteroidales bacterium]HPE57492.1 3-dehydroquinate synthase [Bacteroidales bacterium]HRX96971.1 3-dehydroquinate synthase [Bacteroidales bacterium]